MNRSYTAERKKKEKAANMAKRPKQQLLESTAMYMTLLSINYFESNLKLRSFYP